MQTNIEVKTVEGFGEEWSKFDQSKLAEEEHLQIFESYFRIFPWEKLPEDAVGFDLGCGSGRWAKAVAPRVGKLICIDASKDALEVAQRNLQHQINCQFHHALATEIPLTDNSMDFGYSLGVLHHTPNLLKGIKQCTDKLKKGAPFLIYLYYDFDNRPTWFRLLWKISDIFRRGISKLPSGIKHLVADIIALTIYFPLARTTYLLEKLGLKVAGFPLSIYRNRSFYTMRTDSLDRFGTRIEHRLTKVQIKDVLTSVGFENIQFSDKEPFWCAVGIKK